MLLLSAFLLVAIESTTTQVVSPSNSLKRALSAFAAADSDRDGQVGLDEARAIPVSPEAFAAQDEDKDAAWSRDEFLLFYRRQLEAGKQKPGPDLEAEIARIGALRRVKIVEESKKLTTESSGRSCDVDSVEKRLEQTLAELQSRAADRKATREDVQRLRNLVIVSGRASASSTGNTEAASSQAAMLQALDRIERQTALGQYAPNDFDALRAQAAVRAKCITAAQPRRADVRQASPTRTGTPGDGVPAVPPKSPEPSVPSGPADARRRAAPPRVEPKPDASPKPPQKPAPKPGPGDPNKDKPSRP